MKNCSKYLGLLLKEDKKVIKKKKKEKKSGVSDKLIMWTKKQI